LFFVREERRTFREGQKRVVERSSVRNDGASWGGRGTERETCLVVPWSLLVFGRKDAEGMAILEVETVADEDLVVGEDLAVLLEGFDVRAAMGGGLVAGKEVLGEKLCGGDEGG
jgi:hypothetical protein